MKPIFVVSTGSGVVDDKKLLKDNEDPASSDGNDSLWKDEIVSCKEWLEFLDIINKVNGDERELCLN
jgi:hypothetical protein